MTSVNDERFRSTVVVQTAGLPAFVEQTWIGRRLRMGGVELLVRRQLARCAVIGFEPGTGRVSGPDLLRLLATDRSTASGIVFGVGAEVITPGEITAVTSSGESVHGRTPAAAAAPPSRNAEVAATMESPVGSITFREAIAVALSDD